ncbi:Peroxidase 17 [Linum perenne]
MELCPQGGNESVIVALYFQDLVGGRGFLNSDETLFTHPLIRMRFLMRLQKGMIKMGDLQSGLPGEVRTNFRVVNGGREIRDELDRWSSCS